VIIAKFDLESLKAKFDEYVKYDENRKVVWDEAQEKLEHQRKKLEGIDIGFYELMAVRLSHKLFGKKMKKKLLHIHHVDNSSDNYILMEGHNKQRLSTALARLIVKRTSALNIYYAWISTHRNWGADGCTPGSAEKFPSDHPIRTTEFPSDHPISIYHVDNQSDVWMINKGYGRTRLNSSICRVILKQHSYQQYFAWISSKRNWAADATTRMDKLMVIESLFSIKWCEEAIVTKAVDQFWSDVKSDLSMLDRKAAELRICKEKKRRKS